MQGSQKHGPYYIRYWREGGKRHKEYVRLADAEGRRAACDERRQARRQVRQMTETVHACMAHAARCTSRVRKADEQMMDAIPVVAPEIVVADALTAPHTMAEVSLDEDVASLARELGQAYAEMLRFRVTQMKETVEKADRAVRQADGEQITELAERPSDQVSWFDLSTLAEHAPELAMSVWQRVKDDAFNEFVSGHRAALALDDANQPWERARFLAIRQAFLDEWQPRGGIDLALIDQMSTAHAQYLFWLERLNQEGVNRALRPASLERRRATQYEPPRLTSAQAVEEAAAMAERFQRLFVRAVRTLRDLRRYAPSVVVQNAAQVNLAAVQQNVATSD